MGDMIIYWLKNNLSLIADIIGILGFVGVIRSFFIIKDIKSSYSKKQKIDEYNVQRKNISNNIDAILIDLKNENNINIIQTNNRIEEVTARLEYYTDIISDKKIKKYLKQCNKKNAKSKRINALIKLSLICAKEEINL